jgi:hypothetical protein
MHDNMFRIWMESLVIEDLFEGLEIVREVMLKLVK